MTNEQSFESDSYLQFIEESIHCGCLWGLEGPEGWALCGSEKYQDTEVMPFWSQPEMAEIHCQDEWEDYRVVPIALAEFIDEWLPGMHSDVFLVGINFDAEMEGEEVEPLDLLADFDKATEDLE
jgi:hypothetical protein